MFDDLRDSASTYMEDEKPAATVSEFRATENVPSRSFLGMTAPQRFVISLMLFLMVTVMGVLVLVVSDKMIISLF